MIQAPPCALPPIDAPASDFETLIDSGWTYLAKGTARWVYRHPDCPWVLKENRCPACEASAGSALSAIANTPHDCHAANNIEIEEWLARDRATPDSHLDPVGEIVTWSRCRRFLIMEYLRDLTSGEQTVPIRRYTDLKRQNFGVDVGGRVKLRDYTEVKEPLPSSEFI